MTLDPTIEKRAYTYAEASRAYSVSVSTLRDAVARGLVRTRSLPMGKRGVRLCAVDLEREFGFATEPEDLATGGAIDPMAESILDALAE